MKSFLTKKAYNLIMSLSDPSDEYNELVSESSGRLKKVLKKARFYVVILIIGVILGAFLQYAYFNPIVYHLSTSPCSDCIRSKELLNKENTCLYGLLPNPQIVSSECRQNSAVIDTTAQTDVSNPLLTENPNTVADTNILSGPGDANEPNKGF